MIKNEISVNLINHKIKNFISSDSARLKLLFQKIFSHENHMRNKKNVYIRNNHGMYKKIRSYGSATSNSHFSRLVNQSFNNYYFSII